MYRTSTTAPNEHTQFEAERIIPQISTASQRVEHTLNRLSTALIRRGTGYLSGAIQEISDNIESGMRTIGRAISLVILDARNTCFPGNWTYHYMPERGRAHLNVLGFLLSSVSLNGNLNNLLISLTRPLSSFSTDGTFFTELASDITTALRARGVIITVSPTEIRELTLLRLVELLNLSGVISYNRPPHDLSVEQLRGLS